MRYDCTCRARAVRSDDIDPPEIQRDRNCPIHGVDPDELRDRKADERRDRRITEPKGLRDD